MKKKYIVVPKSSIIQDIFIQQNRFCEFFIDDNGYFLFDSKESAINALVNWGLGSKAQIGEFFANNDLILKEYKQ